MEGFQKRLSEPGSKDVNLARIEYHERGASCSCGWAALAFRAKVLEDKIDRHLNKRHEGRGLRL